MLNVRLFDRAAAPRQITFPAGLEVSVTRHSVRAIGGPAQAEIEVTGKSSALWQMAAMLRYGIEIYNDLGDTVWWGYIHEMSINIGAIRVGYSLDGMANNVAVAYTPPDPRTGRNGDRRTTAYAQDAYSIALYGTKEMVDSAGSATDAEALARRSKILAATASPPHSIEFGGASGEQDANTGSATITCLGWFETLSWISYTALSVSLSYMALPAGYGQIDAVSRIVSYGLLLSEDQTFDIGTTTSQKARFSYLVPGTEPQLFRKLKLKAAEIGTVADNMLVTVYADNAGVPGAFLSTATLTPADIAAVHTWADWNFSVEVWVQPGARVWFEIGRSGANNNTNYYRVAASSLLGHTSGASTLYNGAAWVAHAPDCDIFFEATTERRESSIALYATAGQQRVAASFVVPGSQASAVGYVAAYLQRVGSPTGTLTAYICVNTAGSPGAVLDSITIAVGAIPTAMTRYEFALPLNYLNAAGTTLWLQFEPSNPSASNFIRVLMDGYAANGNSVTKTYNGATWAAPVPDADMYFEIVGVQETSVQMVNIETACGQFIAGIDMENASGVFTDPFRADTSGLSVLTELLETGASSGRRMLAELTRDRRLRIWTEPSVDTNDYYIDSSGQLFNARNVPVQKDAPIVGVWARLRDVHPPALESPSGFAVFIEEMEYQASTDSLIPRARSARGPYDVGVN